MIRPELRTSLLCHTLEFADTRGDYTDDLILGQYYFAKAGDALEKGDKKVAQQNLEYALYATGRDALFLNWAGVTAAQGKAYDLAANYFDAAYTLRPENEEIAANYTHVHEKIK